MWFGESEANVRDVFDKVSKLLLSHMWFIISHVFPLSCGHLGFFKRTIDYTHEFISLGFLKEESYYQPKL